MQESQSSVENWESCCLFGISLKIVKLLLFSFFLRKLLLKEQKRYS